MMLGTLTIRRRLQLLGLGGVLMGLVIGALALRAFGAIGRSVDDLNMVSNAVRHHMDADMMHDAIRADVFGALAATAPEDMAEALADAEDHGTRLGERMAENAALALPAEVLEGIRAAEQPLRAYREKSVAIIQLASNDHDAAVAMLPDFRAAFGDLEESMEHLGDQVQAEADRAAEASIAVRHAARTMMIGCSLVGMALLWFGGW